jgi:hypothetical protein
MDIPLATKKITFRACINDLREMIRSQSPVVTLSKRSPERSSLDTTSTGHDAAVPKPRAELVFTGEDLKTKRNYIQ